MGLVFGFVAWAWMIFRRPWAVLPMLLIYLPLRYGLFFVALFSACAVALVLVGNTVAAFVFALLSVVVVAMNLGALGERLQLVWRIKNNGH